MSKYQFRQSDIYLPGTDLPVNRGELIGLHPFYELNGRITRLFFDLITIANGYGPIDYGRALQDDPEVDNNYIRASIDCVQRADSKLLQTLIEAGLIRNEKLARACRVIRATKTAAWSGLEPYQRIGT